MLIIQSRNFFLKRVEMVRQYIVYIVEQRYFIFADYPQYEQYALVKSLAYIDCFACPCNPYGRFQKHCCVIRIFASRLAATRFLASRGFGSGCSRRLDLG